MQQLESASLYRTFPMDDYRDPLTGVNSAKIQRERGVLF